MKSCNLVLAVRHSHKVETLYGKKMFSDDTPENICMETLQDIILERNRRHHDSVIHALCVFTDVIEK